MATRVLALVGEADGCSAWRIFQPFAELQRRGYPAEWDYLHNAGHVYPLAARMDAVILPRLHWPPEERARGDRFLAALHNAGLAVIYEVDDDMFSEDFHRRLVDVHGKPHRDADDIRESIFHTLRGADGVTVSSQRLATIVRQHTERPVEVVPNAIDLPWFRAVQARAERQGGGLTIGWAGGIRPDSDVAMMAEAWGRIAARFPAVMFVVIGHQPPVIAEHVPAERVRAVPWMPVEEYPLGMAHIDIGCCPLADTAFNRAKTFIKAMEYAAGGAAVVASPTVYGQLITHGRDGFLCETAGEWEAALARLVTSANVRRGMARRLAVKVEREHALEKTVLRWPVAWTRIVEAFRARRRLFVPAAWSLPAAAR
jgi:glycosyltransferase involved in cell wall biosynthesis